MKESRGEFRGIRVCIIDGKDFQALSPEAKLVFYTLKLRCGQAGICVVPALFASLEEQTGYDYEQIGGAINQLTERGWIKLERNVVWIVDGLKHEPSYFAGNPKHQIGLRRYLDSLPRLPIVDEFRKYYSYLPGLSPGDADASGSHAEPVPVVSSNSEKHGSAPAGKRTRTKQPAKEPVENWVAEGTIWWEETVGSVGYARFGKALKPFVDKYGWERVKLALMEYCVEMQGKPIRVEWFAADAITRIERKPLQTKHQVKPWEQEEHDLAIAKQPQVIQLVKAHKKSLNGSGEEWWKQIVSEAKRLNRHPVALAHEKIKSESALHLA